MKWIITLIILMNSVFIPLSACGAVTVLAVLSADHKFEAIIREKSTASRESTIEIRDPGGNVLAQKDFTSTDGEHGLTIDFALWTPDSQFFVFTTHGSGGHMGWQFPSFFFDRRDKKIHAFAEFLPPIANEKFRLKPPDIITLTIWTPLSPEKPLDKSIELEITFKMKDLHTGSTVAEEVSGCDAKVVECLQPYKKQKLTSDNIKEYVKTGRACFSSDQVVLQQQAGCFLPNELGTDIRNNQIVGLSYFCSDICPGYGGVILQYVGVQEKECCKIGGNPKHDAAWGGYIGCQPKEVPLPKFFWPDEKGVMKLAVRNPCNPSEITIVGDIPSDRNKR